MAISIETALASDVIELGAALEKLHALASKLEKRYYANGVSSIVTDAAAGAGVGDSGIIKEDYLSYLVLTQQFLRFCNNQAVTQADYLNTIAKLGMLKDRQ